MLLLNPRRTRTNMKLLQLVWIFLLTLCGQSAVIKIQVKEDDEAILDCSFSTNIKNEPFAWKKDVDQSNEEVFWYSGGDTDPGPEFRGRVFHFPDQLQFGNASIKITKAKTSDSGTYTCYHATVQKEIKSTISLTVGPILKDRSDEKIEGASPEPSVTNLEETQTSALLRCVVRGASPKPEVVWMDSDGTTLRGDESKATKTTGNKYDTVLRITVTKTDNYTCVATQKEINHQINNTIFVRLNGGASKPNAKEINETKDGVLLQCVVQDPSPQTKVFWKDSTGQDVRSEEQKTENSIILWATVTMTDYYRCVTTEGKKDDELYDEIRVKITDGSWTKLLIGIVVGVVLTVAVGVIAWCCCKKKLEVQHQREARKDII
ncbi:CD276 antigen-like isoform X3 [Acanthochromis polyacanthus]|uniref:CD276 antigen-like isoform X1 n=1 Tax=Acanthochromis polyacanthus TaxID=80966 RepID=UPI0022341D36|nr:CD276 antigen-like isoform X1 [Acanthochromis polyacanthus]XP_051803881.1 CD276 antigen-like isoform X3 [Acanthochromis polyacanthus]